MTQFLFVGERPSSRAVKMGVSWIDGRLCAKTLHEALRAISIDPLQQRYHNLFHTTSGRLNRAAIGRVRAAMREHPSLVVVALGRKVQRALSDAGIPHRVLTHPAARGLIRETRAYRKHVCQVLYSPQEA